MRDPQEVCLELSRDPTAAGKQYFKFELYQNDNGEREFYHTNGAIWWQGAQTLAESIGGAGTGIFSLVLYMDATYAKKNNYYRVLYGMFRMLFRMLFRILILIMFTIY